MSKKSSPFLRIEDHFSEIAEIPVITVFENRLPVTPRFTIAIPTFKRAETLREALESVLNQDTSEQFEVIVSDNNPERNDETETLMAEYADVPNLTYIKNSNNLGMVGNWNRLPLLTRGKYMVILHDDDCIAPFFLSSATVLLEKCPDADLLQFTKIHEKKYEFQRDALHAERFRIVDNILGNALSAPTGTIYLRDTLLKAGGWNPHFYPSHDYCFDCLLMCHGYRVYASPLKATFYRIDINVSLKKETQVGCMIIDTNLRHVLFRHIGFPGFVRRRFIEHYNEIKIKRLGLTQADIKPILVGQYRAITKNIAGWLTYRIILIQSRFMHSMDKIFKA